MFLHLQRNADGRVPKICIISFFFSCLFMNDAPSLVKSQQYSWNFNSCRWSYYARVSKVSACFLLLHSWWTWMFCLSSVSQSKFMNLKNTMYCWCGYAETFRFKTLGNTQTSKFSLINFVLLQISLGNTAAPLIINTTGSHCVTRLTQRSTKAQV